MARADPQQDSDVSQFKLFSHGLLYIALSQAKKSTNDLLLWKQDHITASATPIQKMPMPVNRADLRGRVTFAERR